MAEGTIVRRGERSWRLKFEAGPRDPDGRRRTRYVTVKGLRKDAERELRRLLAEVDSGSFTEPSKESVAAHLRHWLDHHAALTVTPKTLERYREIVEHHLVPALGAHQLRALRADHVQEAWTTALATGRRDGKGGLAPRTVIHLHRVLAQALDQAVRSRKIAANPMAGKAVRPPRPAETEIDILTDDQLATLLRAAAGHRLYVPTVLAATTGMRRGEVLALRWRDVDLDGAALKVAQSLEVTKAGGLRFKEPKSRAGRRTIALPALTVTALRAHRAEQAERRLRLGAVYDTEADLVVARDDGRPIDPRIFSKDFGQLVGSIAGLPAVTFHGLRHTHVTSLLDRGVNPKVVSERAGHSTIAITLQVYGHVLKGRQEAVAAGVDEAIRTAIERADAAGCQLGANNGVVEPFKGR
ncbi:MAG: tyrosine-type recombinase/integrase [Alphaproteobacteria bacterium]